MAETEQITEIQSETDRQQLVEQFVTSEWAKSDIRERLLAEFGEEGYQEIKGFVPEAELDEAIDETYQGIERQITISSMRELKKHAGNILKKEGKAAVIGGVTAMAFSALTGLGAAGAIFSPVFWRGTLGRVAGRGLVDAFRTIKGEERHLIETIINEHLSSYAKIAERTRYSNLRAEGYSHEVIDYKSKSLEDQKASEKLTEDLINFAHEHSQTSENTKENIEKYHEIKALWDKRADRAAFIGSMGGILSGALSYWQNIMSGEGARLNIDVFREPAKQQGAHIVKNIDGVMKFVSNAGKEVYLGGLYGGQATAAAVGVVQRAAAESIGIIGYGIKQLWGFSKRLKKQEAQRQELQTEYQQNLAKQAETLEIKNNIPYQKGEVFIYHFSNADLRCEAVDASKGKLHFKILDDGETAGNGMTFDPLYLETAENLQFHTEKGAYTKEEKELLEVPEEKERYENLKNGMLVLFRQDQRPHRLAPDLEYKILKVDKDRNEIVLYSPDAPDKRYTFKLTYLIRLADFKTAEEKQKEEKWTKEKLQELADKLGKPLPISEGEIWDKPIRDASGYETKHILTVLKVFPDENRIQVRGHYNDEPIERERVLKLSDFLENYSKQAR